MYARAMFHPFQVNHLAREVLRGVLLNFQLLVRYEIPVGAVSMAARAQRLRLNR